MIARRRTQKDGRDVRVEVLTLELGDELGESLLVGLDGDGGEKGLDVLSRGGGLHVPSEQQQGKGGGRVRVRPKISRRGRGNEVDGFRRGGGGSYVSTGGEEHVGGDVLHLAQISLSEGGLRAWKRKGERAKALAGRNEAGSKIVDTRPTIGISRLESATSLKSASYFHLD
jgi:hypothetical protein